MSFLPSGCSQPGDVVCDRQATQSLSTCQYSLCILASENLNLWNKPRMTVARLPCPQNIGVATDFCNNNALLLAILYGKHHQDDFDEQFDGLNYQQRMAVIVRTPCIVRRRSCEYELSILVQLWLLSDVRKVISIVIQHLGGKTKGHSCLYNVYKTITTGVANNQGAINEISSGISQIWLNVTSCISVIRLGQW